MQTELSQAIKENDFHRASNLLPTRIDQVFDQPKVCDMVKAIGEQSVKFMVQFELVKLAGLMSVGGNLNAAQIDFVSDQLITLHPYETIADFKLCFKRGAIGLYGDIQRLDGITIGIWMQKYLDEKYTVLENKLMNEKDEMYKPAEPVNQPDNEYDPDNHSRWLKQLADAVKPIQKVPGMTDEEIKRLGHPDANKLRKPTITAGYAYFNVRGVQIYAGSQEHAEQLCELLLKNGDLEEDL